ncbi:MAG: DMT family transporter [Firmicutes bacterium]|uniref:DMT family transporter n=1 Tax=Melghirimyces thermohalophilus TaxID=1236220 RepID=UPI0015A410F5|nr:DMT family transporter [Melghirimyces thermohalophilus]MDA8354062.1 DMT family transporter [Bacillota bacterium]
MSRKQAKVLLLVITVIWGYTWIPMKVGLEVLGPFSFSFYRFLLGALFLIPIAFRKSRPRIHKEDLGWLLLLGVLQTTATFGFFMAGMKSLPAGTSSILAYTMPLWTYGLAWLFLSERLTAGKIGGLLLGIVGLVGVAGPEAAVGRGTLTGMVWVLAGAVCWGGSNVLVRARFSRHEKLSLTAIQMVVGTVGLALLTLMFEPAFTPDRWSLSVVANLLFTGILSSAFAFVAWFTVVSVLGAGEAAVSALLVPVFAVFFGWLQLGETISAMQVAGVVLVLIGITLVQRKEPQKGSISTDRATDAEQG